MLCSDPELGINKIRFFPKHAHDDIWLSTNFADPSIIDFQCLNKKYRIKLRCIKNGKNFAVLINRLRRAH